MAGEREINEELFQSMRRADETFDQMGNVERPAPLTQGAFEFLDEVPVVQTGQDGSMPPRNS